MEPCWDQTGNSSGEWLWASLWTWGAASSGLDQVTSRGLFSVYSSMVPHTTVPFSLSQHCCEQTCNSVQISMDFWQILQNCSCEWRKGEFWKHCTFWKVDNSLGLGPYLTLLGWNVQKKKIICWLLLLAINAFVLWECGRERWKPMAFIQFLFLQLNCTWWYRTVVLGGENFIRMQWGPQLLLSCPPSGI